MLSPAQVTHYQEKGYVIPDYRIAEDVLDRIRQHHASLIAKYPQFTDYCPALYVYDSSFVQYAKDSIILDMVEQLIGPNFAIWNSSFFAKPALNGTRTPWHQDGEYWPIQPLATCSVWIAVDDANTENGCLEFIPGSHRNRRLSPHHTNNAQGLALPLELDADAFQVSAAVPIELKAGQMSLHDVFLMHASEPNRSPNPRRGMTLRFMPTSSIYNRGLQKGVARDIDAKRPIFHMRGRDISNKNNLIYS